MFFVKYSYRVGYIELQSWRLTLGNSINSDSTNSKNGDHPGRGMFRQAVGPAEPLEPEMCR